MFEELWATLLACCARLALVLTGALVVLLADALVGGVMILAGVLLTPLCARCVDRDR